MPSGNGASTAAQQTGRALSYEEAKLGFRNYWYPAMFSRDLKDKPVTRTLLGEDVVFLRRHGKAYALEDRCPHRSIPLHLGKNDFPKTSTIVCRYHGWVFDVTNGACVAALTDGPDSPVVGKVRVRTYPVVERMGIVWVWMGAMAPVPLEEDVPEELRREDAIIEGWFRVRPGNWRLAAENGFDSAHAKYLHRDSVWQFFTHAPAWDHSRILPTPDGKWLTRARDVTADEGDFPGLGPWPRRRFWRRPGGLRLVPWARKGPNPIALRGVSLRLPGFLRVNYNHAVHYEWYVPVDQERHLYVQLLVDWGGGVRGLWHRLKYRLWVKWLFHWRFNGQDASMVELMTRAEQKQGENRPVRLFRPDVSITAWRKMVETTARGEVAQPAQLTEEVPEEGAATYGRRADR